MRMKNILSAGAMALLLAGWGSTLAFATTSATEIENLGGVGQVDTWEAKCKGKATALHAQVADRGAADDRYIITTIGLTPGTIKADADTEQNTLGTLNFSPSASLFRSTPGGIKAWVIVSQIVGGDGNYTLRITCTDSDVLPDLDIKQDQD